MFKFIMKTLAAVAFLAFGAASAEANNSATCTTGATSLSALIAEINNCILVSGNANLTDKQLNGIFQDVVSFINPTGIFGAIPNAYVLGNASGVSAPSSSVSVSSLLDQAFSSSQGTIIYRGTSTWLPLSPGTSGQVLALTFGGVPGWSSVSGTGTVTLVSAGAGLAGGPITGAGTLTLDWTYGDSGQISQTVRSGPVNTSGYPNFLPATTGSLSITGQNISSSSPLVLNAWSPPDANGAHSITCVFTTAPTWSTLVANSTNYLFEVLSTSGGVCSPSFGTTTLAPIYQIGGTPSTTTGQITCNIGSKQCYFASGGSAPATAVVVVGEAATNSSAVTSSVNYAYNGYYDSGWTSTLPNVATLTTQNSNIGAIDTVDTLSIKNLTAEFNYSVGDIVDEGLMSTTGTTVFGITVGHTRNTEFFTTGSSGPWYVFNKTSGGIAGLTLANWAYRLQARRAW